MLFNFFTLGLLSNALQKTRSGTPAGKLGKFREISLQLYLAISTAVCICIVITRSKIHSHRTPVRILYNEKGLISCLICEQTNKQ